MNISLVASSSGITVVLSWIFNSCICSFLKHYSNKLALSQVPLVGSCNGAAETTVILGLTKLVGFLPVWRESYHFYHLSLSPECVMLKNDLFPPGTGNTYVYLWDLNPYCLTAWGAVGGGGGEVGGGDFNSDVLMTSAALIYLRVTSACCCCHPQSSRLLHSGFEFLSRTSFDPNQPHSDLGLP